MEAFGIDKLQDDFFWTISTNFPIYRVKGSVEWQISHFYFFCFIPCCRLSWLLVSFLLHVKYTLYTVSQKVVHQTRGDNFCQFSTDFQNSFTADKKIPTKPI